MRSPSGAPDDDEERRDSRVGLVLSERYRVDGLLDRGAMGRVYVGEHVLMRKRVAIKVLHRELTTVPEFVARFEREAMAAANIDSEHVVAATDFGKLPDGSVFLILEFIEGKNLRDEMAAGPIPLPRALHITRQIAYALRSAHALSIVHRDLKPENVMLVDRAGDRDFVKVLDFGIAKVPIGEVRDEVPSSRPITKAGMVFGTPEYMPPEQALGQNVDHRADIYSLGVILFEMLAGVRPFVGTSQVGVLGQQIAQPAPKLSARAPGVTVPPAVQRFLDRLLDREASGRIQTAELVLTEIDRHLGYSSGKVRIPTLRHGTSAGAADSDPASPSFPPPGDDELPTRFGVPRPSQAPMARLGRLVDANRGRLPGPLRSLPAPILLSAPLAILGVVVGFGIVSALGDPSRGAAGAASAAPSAATTTRAEAVAPPPGASAEELRAALEGGRDALAELGKRYPRDAAVPLALAQLELKDRQTEKAVTAIAEALSLDPQRKNDAQIASALWIAAQNRKSAGAAFAVLRGPMEDRGRAILRDLTTTQGVKPATKDEAARVLRELEN